VGRGGLPVTRRRGPRPQGTAAGTALGVAAVDYDVAVTAPRQRWVAWTRRPARRASGAAPGLEGSEDEREKKGMAAATAGNGEGAGYFVLL